MFTITKKFKENKSIFVCNEVYQANIKDKKKSISIVFISQRCCNLLLNIRM